MTKESAAFVRELLLRRAGIAINASKDYLIVSRLLPVAQAFGYASLDEAVLAARREERAPLTHAMVEALTINETYFFRDGLPYTLLRETLLPAAITARTGSQTLRIWSAAASTGQEPYSIAMTIRDHFPELKSWDVRILATDINATVLGRARAGVYRGFEVNRGLSRELIARHFVEMPGEEWHVNQSLKKLVDFRVLNLLDPWPMKEWVDIVFMRNVLIYFEPLMKTRILQRVRDHMHPEGALLLGGGEAAVSNGHDFETMRAGAAVYYRARPRKKRAA